MRKAIWHTSWDNDAYINIAGLTTRVSKIKVLITKYVLATVYPAELWWTGVY